MGGCEWRFLPLLEGASPNTPPNNPVARRRRVAKMVRRSLQPILAEVPIQDPVHPATTLGDEPEQTTAVGRPPR